MLSCFSYRILVVHQWEHHDGRTDSAAGDDLGYARLFIGATVVLIHSAAQITLGCECPREALSPKISVLTLMRVSRANLVHPRLIETTTAAFPRKGWSEHFARVVEKELALKPWCHTSTFEVPEGERDNEIMQSFDSKCQEDESN